MPSYFILHCAANTWLLINSDTPRNTDLCASHSHSIENVKTHQGLTRYQPLEIDKAHEDQPLETDKAHEGQPLEIDKAHEDHDN